MKVKVYNQKGETEKEITLPKKVFGQDFNSDLVHQVVCALRSNRRQGTAHSKDRSEVRGGGKKPWRQKGTGRARHGSIRSPLWIGGGVTFGPRKERNYKKKLTKKMKQKALQSVLSQKLKDKEVFIINGLKLENPKTKELAEFLDNLVKKLEKEELKKLLLVIDKRDDKLLRAAANLKKVEVREARNLNALDVCLFNTLIILKDSLKTIENLVSE